MKRILIVVMLFFMFFAKYAGVPAQGLSPEFTAAYSEIELVKYTLNQGTAAAEAEITPEITPTPGVTPVPPDSPAPGTTPVPSVTPVPGVSPTPPVTPVPGTIPTPEGTPTPVSTPDPEDTPLPEATPLPQTSPPPQTSLPIDLGPLTDNLPTFDTTSPQAIKFKNDMSAIVNKAVKQSGIRSAYGLFIMDLKTEMYYGINENLTRIDQDDNVPEGYFSSASVIKLFQGYLFCDMIRRGELDAEKTYYDKVTGRKFKLIPMLKSMISRSDNNYCNACLRIVDNKRSNEVLNRLGIKNSRIYGEISPAIGYSKKNNIAKYGTAKSCARITPMDAGLILYNVYKNKDSDPFMKVLNEALLGNIYNSRIPVGVKRVSQKYPVAHKTGTSSSMGVYNDAGIVYCRNPYILVAFTQGTTSSAGHSFIRSLAEQLTRYYNNR